MCVSSQHNKAPGCCLKHKLIVRRGATESTPFTLRQGRKHTEKLLLSHFQVQRELQGHTSPSLRQRIEPSFPVSAISPETSSLGSFVSHDLSILPSKRQPSPEVHLWLETEVTQASCKANRCTSTSRSGALTASAQDRLSGHLHIAVHSLEHSASVSLQSKECFQCP